MSEPKEPKIEQSIVLSDEEWGLLLEFLELRPEVMNENQSQKLDEIIQKIKQKLGK